MELAQGRLSAEGSFDVFSLVVILEGDILPRDRNIREHRYMDLLVVKQWFIPKNY